MSYGGDPPASLTVIAGIVGTVLLLAVVLFAQVLFYNVQRIEDDTKQYAGKPRELADLQARQLAEINTYRYVDQANGVVAIPIDRAMELYATEVQTVPAPTTIPSPGRGEPDTPGSGPAR